MKEEKDSLSAQPSHFLLAGPQFSKCDELCEDQAQLDKAWHMPCGLSQKNLISSVNTKHREQETWQTVFVQDYRERKSGHQAL